MLHNRKEKVNKIIGFKKQQHGHDEALGISM